MTSDIATVLVGENMFRNGNFEEQNVWHFLPVISVKISDYPCNYCVLVYMHFIPVLIRYWHFSSSCVLLFLPPIHRLSCTEMNSYDDVSNFHPYFNSLNIRHHHSISDILAWKPWRPSPRGSTPESLRPSPSTPPAIRPESE